MFALNYSRKKWHQDKAEQAKQAKNYGKAIDEFKKAGQVGHNNSWWYSPDICKCFYEKANVEYSKRKYGSALDSISSAITRSSDNIDYFELRIKINKQLNRNEHVKYDQSKIDTLSQQKRDDDANSELSEEDYYSWGAEQKRVDDGTCCENTNCTCWKKFY